MRCEVDVSEMMYAAAIAWLKESHSVMENQCADQRHWKIDTRNERISLPAWEKA